MFSTSTGLAMQNDFCDTLKKMGKCDYGDCKMCSVNVAMHKQYMELRINDKIAVNTSRSYSSSQSRKESGLGWLPAAAIVCAVVFCLYALNTEKLPSYLRSPKVAATQSVNNQSQRTYIANTYEAFAKAKVGDWYRDIHNGNVPKQVTQVDINWAKQKLNERQ